MKKCIITINLLFYITFFHQWNCVESNPTTPDGTESSSASTKPTQETTPKGTPSTGTGTKGTPVTLDIKNTQSTNEYNYTDQNGVITYTPKSDNVFNKITQGTTDIWESKDNVCGTLVRTKTSKNVKFLVVLLTNNMFTLFHEESGEWKDITSDRHDVTKLKFLGDNDAELASSDYTVSIVDLSFTYIFNDGVNCKKIKLADADVWNYTDDPKFSEIKLFSLGLASNNFFVKNQSNELKKIEKSDLDLKSTQPTSESLHSDQKGVATLTPKEGDGISGVIRSSGQERDTWTAIWQIQCEFDVQKTISFEDFGKGRQVLTLNTRSGKKMLHRPKEGEPWKEVVDQHQNAFETVEELKSLKQDSSDVTETEVSIEDDTEEQDPSDPTETKEPTATKETEQKDPKKEPEKQLTLVELDLIQTASSDNFEYVKKNEFSSYEAKPGCLFNKVIRSASSAFSKEKVFWESDSNSEKHVKMVRIKLSDNHIALLLNNGEFLLFHKESEDKDWNDITDQRNNFSGFKFFAFVQNDSEYKELDPSSYTIGFNEFSYGVSFSDDFECHQIKHNDKLIYNYESDEDFGILKGVYLGLSSNKFFLTNLEEDNKRLDLDKEVTPPKPKPKPTGETAHIVIQELPEQKSDTAIPSAELTSSKLTSLNINDTGNTPEYQFSDNGIYKTFTALHGNGFNKIMNPKTFGADEVIWQTSGNDYAIKVRLKEASNGEKYVLLLFVSKRYQFFYSGKKNSPFKDITYTKHSFSDIKLFSKNETTNVYEQLDPTSYNLSLYHLSLGYRAKEGEKFHLVKLGNDLVYNYKDDINFGDLRAAYLDLIENNLYVMNMNDQTKVVKELSRLKTTTIDLNKAESTDQFHCTKDDDFVTYTSIGNNLFEKLIRSSRLGSDEVIWRVIDNIYAKKILVDGQGKKGKISNTILHLENGDIKHLNYSDGKWVEVSNKVSIDITKTQSSNVFDYSVDDEFKTFSAKSSFLFNSLVEPDSSGTDKIIWKTSNPSEYGNKLVLKESGNKKYLAMFRVDNKFLLLHKNPSSQNWEDITNTRLNLSDLKMFYFDSDTTGYLLFKDEQYSVSLEKFLYGYEFNGETKCHLIKYRDSVIWNHGDDQKHGSLKSVLLNLLNNKITVSTPDGESNEINIPGISRPSDIEAESIEEFEEDDDSDTSDPTETSEAQEQDESSTQITIPPGNLIELDLKIMESTDNYEYIESNDNHVFTAKNGFGFSKIKKGDHDLKECPSPHYYCKVVANYGQHNKIILYVYKTDKDFDLLLLDDPDSSTRDITSLPSDTVQALQASKVVSEQLKLLASSEDGQSKELDDNKLMIEELTHLINYRFPENTKCSEIKYNEKTVWKYDKSIHGRYYPTNMLLNTNTSFILLESQNHYQYYYTYINDEWKCISGYKTQDLQPLYPDKLRIFTLNQFGLICVDDTTQFNKSVKGPITSFALNPGSKCVHVKYGEEEVWSYNYNDHEDKYPTLVTVNTDEKTVMVDSSGTYRYLFSYSAGQFSCVFAFKSRLIDPIDPEKIKFSTTDTSGTYIELDKSKYDVEQPDTTYKFTSDPKCTCIKYNNTEVWKHNTSDHNDKYPTSVSFNNLNRNYLVVESSSSYRNIFQFQNNEFKLLSANEKLNYDCNSTGVFDPDKLKFMTQDPDSNQLVELDYTRYSLEHPSFITYKFKDSVKCSEIGYENQSVWKYDENEHSDEFPTTVSINLKKSYVIVDSSHFYRYVYSYYDKKWKELPFGYKTSNISFDKFKLFTTDPNDQNNPVELDPSQYEIEYSQNVLAIKFNTNVKCTCIMYDKKDIWRYKQNEHKDKYPTTTVFNKKKSTVLVDSGYHYRYLYIYQNKEWKALPYGYTLRLRFSKTQLFDTTKLQVFTMDRNKTLVLMPTNEYDVDDTQTLVSYVFRYSKNCYCVKYNQKVVWEYKQDEHGDNYPRISLNKMTNIMLIESGHYYRYMFQFENGEWKLLPFSYRFNPKTDLVDPDKFKLLTLDSDENLVELDSSRYKREDTNNVTNFKIQYGVKCTSVKYDQKDVWKYNRGEHEYKYPTKISLNKNKKFFLVESGYDYRYLYQLENGEWKLLPFGNKLKTTQSYAFDWSKFKLLSINLSNKPFELDYSNYDRVPNGNILTYTLNPDVKCTEVKYDNTTVWNYNYDDHENNYPTTIIFNRNNGFLIVESKDHYESYYSYYDNKWHSVYGYKASKITKNKEFYKLKLYETNEDGLLEPITGFHEEVTGPVITCNIYYGVKCTHVKYDEKTAWVYDSQKHLDHFPTSVVFNITNGTIKVECQDQYVYFSTFINEEWKPFSGFRNKLTNARPEVKLFQKAKSGKYAFINPSKYNVNWDGENDVYEYDLNNLSCVLLKHHENTVWSQTSDEHPKSITYNSDQSKFVLRFDNEYIFCSFEDNEWKKMSRRYGTQSTQQETAPTEDSAQPEDSTEAEAEPVTKPEETAPEPEPANQITTPETDPLTQQTSSVSPPSTTPSTVTKPEPTKVSLNIEKKEITYQYEYFKNDDIHTFTPKDNHVFSKVSQGTRDIWESTNDVFGAEVMFIDGNDKYLAILLTNNMFILYKEADKDLTAETLDVKKLMFLGDNDTVISTSDYDLTIVDYAYGYLFNDSVNCRMVKYSDLDVWKHTDDPEFSSLKSLRLDLHKNRFYVTNSSDKTKQVAIKIALDIKQSEDTTQYNFKHSARALYSTLTPKSGHVFNKVSHGPNLVWESKNDIYGTLVRTKLKGNNIYLAILLTNNMFTIFHQEIDSTKYVAILFDDNMFKLSKECGGTWNDITADRADITKLKFFGEGDVELSKSDYTVSIVVLSYEFKFKEGVTCKKITYSDLDVWKDSDYTDFADIKSFRLGLATNKFFVKNQSDETKDLGTKPTQAKATPVTKPEETTTSTTPSTTAQTPETKPVNTPTKPTTPVTTD